MTQINLEYINRLLEFVKEGNEAYMEFEPDKMTIEVMPWKPFEYKCPYKKGEEK